MKMSKKDYSLKFYKATMLNDNDESYNFYLAERSPERAYKFIERHVNTYNERYHIFPGENDIKKITLIEVPVKEYGNEYGYEVIN